MSKVQVKNLRASTVMIGSVQLMPGMNHVDKDFYEKKKFAFDPMVKGKILEIGDVKETTEKGEPVTDENLLTSYNAKEAMSLVKETFDMATLEAWKADEERVTVRSAIDDQIKTIEDAANRDKEKGKK